MSTIATDTPTPKLDEVCLGRGAGLVVLHGEDGLLFCGEFLRSVGERFAVSAPLHPGWGASPRGKELSSIDDLSYVYLDYLEALATRAEVEVPLALVGCSLGGWLAADIAIKSQAQISALILVSPLGIKVSDRGTREFVDIYASPRAEVERAVYSTGTRPALEELDASDFEYLARAQEAVAHYCWKPYFHDPKLLARLHRISVPTLVIWGEEDGFVLNPASYYEAFAGAIGPNATTRRLPGVAHRPEQQAPQLVADAIAEFVEHGGSR